MTVTKFFNRVFNVFSRRRTTNGLTHEIPQSFRNRVFLWLADVFGNTRTSFNPAWSGGYGLGDYRSEFWSQVHKFLQFHQGLPQLAPHSQSPGEDAIAFLHSCDGEVFLDFLEYIFRVDCYFYVMMPEQQVVEELNELFRHDDLPYHVTEFIKEEVREIRTDHPFAGRETTNTKMIAYPQVVMRSSDVVHAHVIEPTLTLLRRPVFRNANDEFLEALTDFRKNDFGNCLTKCGSALESVMKVLCKENRWAYDEKDTASTLVKIMIDKLKLDGYYEPILMIVATLRNRLSKSHGAGAVDRSVSRPVAEYAVNSTASAILFLVQETGKG